MTELQFELCWTKKAIKLLRVDGHSRWVVDMDRLEALPEDPSHPGFGPMSGSYGEVSKRATALNEMQMRSHFVDYLFYPEVKPVSNSHT